ncbi:hypothetical protein NN561_016493 [Cricetulus griseus]
MGARAEMWWSQGGRGSRDTPRCPGHWAPLWGGMRRLGDQASAEMGPESSERLSQTTGWVLEVSRRLDKLTQLKMALKCSVYKS